MNDTKTTNDLVKELRHVSKMMQFHRADANITFPPLYPPENAGPKFIEAPIPLIDEALSTIRRGGKLNTTCAAALVYYIADMMEE